MKWHVYVIECKNKSLYTGITTDLKRRFSEHKRGVGCKFSAYNPARKLVYSETFKTRSAASKREAEIKGWTRAEKLAVIRGMS